MGRVYEALKRAAENSNGNGRASSDTAPVEQQNGATSSNGAVNTNGDAGNTNGSAKTNGSPNASYFANAADHRPDSAPPIVAPSDKSFEHVIGRSSLFQHSPANDALSASAAANLSSALNEHTEQPAGSALPGDVTGSRVAGATLGAVSSARAREFPGLEIIPARVEPHLVSITEPRTPYSERYRSLRTRVLHAGETRGVQTIVVASNGIMEGKTITAINLAWQLAQADGVRALLIDGDLRHPCAADYLSIETPIGLSDVLTGGASLEDAVVRLDPAGLHLLPGGTACHDVADLLSGPRFAAVIAEARRMFNFIIIDAPPLSIFTDAAVLMNRADAALLVIRAGRVRYAQLDRLLEGLPHDRILGVVMNGAEERIDESNYYYYRRDDRRRFRGKGKARLGASVNNADVVDEVEDVEVVRE